jgi:hypothetical protein
MNLCRISIVLVFLAGLLDGNHLQAQTYTVKWESVAWKDNNHKVIVLKGRATDTDPNRNIAGTKIYLGVRTFGGTFLNGDPAIGEEKQISQNGDFEIEVTYPFNGPWPVTGNQFNFEAHARWDYPWPNPTGQVVVTDSRGISIQDVNGTKIISLVQAGAGGPGGGN